MRQRIYRFGDRMFKRTRKNAAIKEIENGKYFFLVGCNVNEFHFHSGWYLATSITSAANLKECDWSVHGLYNNVKRGLDRELGRYPVFYVEV